MKKLLFTNHYKIVKKSLKNCKEIIEKIVNKSFKKIVNKSYFKKAMSNNLFSKQLNFPSKSHKNWHSSSLKGQHKGKHYKKIGTQRKQKCSYQKKGKERNL